MDRNKLSDFLGVKIVSAKTIGGGCIANSQLVADENGRKYFVKNYGLAGSSILRNEANGLIELEKARALRVPKVILMNDEFLVLEFIETGKRKGNFFEEFGRAFAKQHRYTSEEFGFFENNYIGANEQKNLPRCKNWREFYFENRLVYQFKLAERNGYVDRKLRDAFKIIEEKVEEIIPDDGEPPCLLHGDLWSGNFMCDKDGNAVLIDPAVYYGHREVDLAMTKLFGGFDSDFYSAYNEAFPLSEDWSFREPIYKLYHVLNHLNLFGWGYAEEAVALMMRYR